jgi:Holliday junction resolvase RusA-like endonuclease
MLSFNLDVRALSINKAWRGGARYRSKDYIEFEKEVLYLLPKGKHVDGEIEIHYKFYLKKNYSNSDTSNLVKALEDVMVRADIITDDSLVKRFTAEKFKADKDSIEVEIISL